MAGIITLIADFGTRDGNVAVMKGVILGINPLIRLVDISHGIAPQSIAQGSYLPQRAHAHFLRGAIHVAVVDPGAGSERRAIFAPVATHLSVGVPVESFGNLLTTIQGVDLFPLVDELEVVVVGRVISGLSRTYADAQDGAVIAYIDSSTHLAIAEVRGDAAEKLGAAGGDVVEVRTAATEDREASP